MEPVDAVPYVVESVLAVAAAERLARPHELPHRDRATANLLGFRFNRVVDETDFGAFDRLTRNCINDAPVNRCRAGKQGWRVGKPLLRVSQRNPKPQQWYNSATRFNGQTTCALHRGAPLPCGRSRPSRGPGCGQERS